MVRIARPDYSTYINRLLRAGEILGAAKIYAGLHNCGMSEAMFAVTGIKREIEQPQGG